MPKFNSIASYKAYNQKRAKALHKAGIKSSSQAASFMKATAKRLAPHYTGETIRGITSKREKDYHIVTSKVSPKGITGFMQNMWANQTAPFRSVRMRWGKGKKVIYGDGTHHTSGTPRFFHIATLRTGKEFSKIARKNVKSALRVQI